ncbi:hypothetical protein GCM10007103_17730 [Salinimicrobium marinum]|uniref:Uncharacterized protein n=1 Tax=Salinimicrobium marinum TaxID=680283 RepID=A0A918SG21_9FLAO|nr:hypothetical protein [Salinimicrobium marinum]GHA36652.1 hypothetical protein GCM10007103_17730 [Salinimicrobium marinum]
MKLFLLQASEDVSESFAYKLGYGVGYVGANYFWELLIAFLLVVAATIYFIVKYRRNRSRDI